MSMNAMHRSVMVFSDSKMRAEKKLAEIAESIEEEILVRTRWKIKTPTKIYQAEWFANHCRGYRYTEVYVDTSLTYNEDIMLMIRMKLVPQHYYEGFERDNNWNPYDHIHYF